jgi:hypothetical protein
MTLKPAHAMSMFMPGRSMAGELRFLIESGIGVDIARSGRG